LLEGLINVDASGFKTGEILFDQLGAREDNLIVSTQIAVDGIKRDTDNYGLYGLFADTPVRSVTFIKSYCDMISDKMAASTDQERIYSLIWEK
jgi:hypothetical protein